MKFYSIYLQNNGGMANVIFGAKNDPKTGKLIVDESRKMFFSPSSSYIIEVNGDNVKFVHYNEEWHRIIMSPKEHDLSEFLPKAAVLPTVKNNKKTTKTVKPAKKRKQ